LPDISAKERTWQSAHRANMHVTCHIFVKPQVGCCRAKGEIGIDPLIHTESLSEARTARYPASEVADSLKNARS